MMLNSIIVFDDIIDDQYQNFLQDTFITSKYYKKYNSSTLSSNDKRNVIDKNTIDVPFISCNLLAEQDIYHLPIVKNLNVNLNYSLNSYSTQRARLNFTFKNKNYSDNNYSPIHKDAGYRDNAMVALYYVNDSDGDTFFFDNNLNIVKKITPKKGKLVYWPNTIYHAGSSPKNFDIRCVISFNFWQ